MNAQPDLFETARRPDFDGVTFERVRDKDRLQAQLTRVFQQMRDHEWHTLEGIARETGDKEASISARIRDLRKAKFGGYEIERRHVGIGLWAYRLRP